MKGDIWPIIREIETGIDFIERVDGAYISGSRLWGSAKEDSDYDVRIIYTPTDRYLLRELSGMEEGYSGPYNLSISSKENVDVHLFSLLKYFRRLPSLSIDTIECVVFFPRPFVFKSKFLEVFLKKAYDALAGSEAFKPLAAFQLWGFALNNLSRLKQVHREWYETVYRSIKTLRIGWIIDGKPFGDLNEESKARKAFFSLWKITFLWKALNGQEINKNEVQTIHAAIMRDGPVGLEEIVRTLKQLENVRQNFNKEDLKNILKDQTAPLLVDLITKFAPAVAELQALELHTE